MNAARNKEYGECREEDKVPVKVKETKKGHGGRNARVARQGKAVTKARRGEASQGQTSTALSRRTQHA